MQNADLSRVVEGGWVDGWFVEHGRGIAGNILWNWDDFFKRKIAGITHLIDLIDDCAPGNKERVIN